MGYCACVNTQKLPKFQEILRGREKEAWKKTTNEYCERTFACHYSLVLFQTSISSTSKCPTLGITNLGCRYSQQTEQESLCD